MEPKNIFEIWKDGGEKLPFAVRREKWDEQFFTVVTGIQIRKWPYGNAYGYPTLNGDYSNHYEYDSQWKNHRIIPCAGCYQWTLVKNVKILIDDYQRFNQLEGLVWKEKKIEEDTYETTYRLLQLIPSLKEIASERGLSVGTIYTHLGVLISRGYPIDIEKYIPKEKQIQIINAANKLNPEKIRVLKDYLGDDFSYEEIRLTLTAESII
jgi:hypothetical protein